MANSLNKITTKSILDATVATADIAADAITGAKIADDAIDSEHYTDGSIDTAHIADDAVTADKLANAINTDIAAKAVLTGSTDNTITTVTGANAIQGEANLTFDGTSLKFNQTQSKINNNTSDASDDKILSINGGGDASQSRGAGITLYGNEVSNNEGKLWLGAGNSGDAEGIISMNTGGAERLRIDSAGKTTSYGEIALSSGGAERLNISSPGAGDIAISNPTAAHLIFKTNNTEEVRILNGGGITFNGDTAAANALDDYEEGTWTPAVNNGVTNTQTFDSTARYTKIGRTVHCQFILQWSGANTGSGTDIVEFSGLPFTALSSTALGGGNVTWTNVPGLSAYDSIDIVVKSNTQIIQLYQGMDGNAVTGNSVSFTNKALYGVFTYEAA